MIIGVDEAGRGPLAGPVCAAAVVLNEGHHITGLADSKTLSEKKRNNLAPIIQDHSLAWGIGWATVEEIDGHDILRATFMAMARAVEECLGRLRINDPGFDLDAAVQSESLLVQVDGNRSPGKFSGPWRWPYATETIIKGDQRVACISAASILAKTARDAEMQRLHADYPEYGFDRHAGYGTAAHMAAIVRHGPSPVHRKTFAPVAKHLTNR